MASAEGTEDDGNDDRVMGPGMSPSASSLGSGLAQQEQEEQDEMELIQLSGDSGNESPFLREEPSPPPWMGRRHDVWQTQSSQHHPHRQTTHDIRPHHILPTAATHAYLGQARSDTVIRSRKDLEVGSTVEMPILSLPGVVLFPGESLPLRLHNSAYAALAESILLGERNGLRGGRTGGHEDLAGSGGVMQAEGHLGVVNRVASRTGGWVRLEGRKTYVPLVNSPYSYLHGHGVVALTLSFLPYSIA